MKLESIPLSELKPAPYNPREKLRPGDPGWEKLSRSLEEFDLVQPIVWNRTTGHIVAGHQRCEILRHHGRQAVDCLVVELPLEREQALNVTLNNPGVGSDWDPDKLVDLLESLADLPDFDPTLTGFDEQELKELLLQPAVSGEQELAEEVSTDVTVTLVVPYVRWAAVREWLDRLLAKEKEVELHVELPPSG